MRLNHALGLLVVCCALTASCSDGSFLDSVDPSKKLDRKDYEKMGDARYPNPIKPLDGDAPNADPEISLKANNIVEPAIPELAEVIAAPKPPKIGTTKVVSIAVTDDVPLKDVLLELAKLADVDVEIDSGITGGITFRAKDRPFNEVIDRVASMAGLRYSMKNNVLRIERDTPFVQTYSIDMLNIDRSSGGTVSVDTTTGSAGGEGSSSGATNSGSKSEITAKTDADFWKQFEASVKQILGYQPAMMATGGAAASAATGEGAGNGNVFYVINRQASTLTVSATQRQQDVVRTFLDKIKKTASSQVIIEAKIVEVSLNDAYQAGIDWSLLSRKFPSSKRAVSGYGGVSGGVGEAAEFGITNVVLDLDEIFGIKNYNLSTAVSLAENFGTTRTLSSPRLTAINNQQAVLTVARNEVYFDVKIETTDAILGPTGQVVTPEKVKATSTIKTSPIGLIMTLQPSIDVDSNEVTLSVRPTLSRIVGSAEDPGFSINAAQSALTAGLKSFVPIIEVRELDSILKIKSGQVMVIGGLMEDTADNNESGIPGANDVPYFGNLFKGHDKTSTKKELVIFIRATIVPTSGYAEPADKVVYEKFTTDPRPLNF